ncbi:hypothetical protein Y032_0432g1362 [Ancylostoma ceylanicum]|uniref:Uncharacterized protein n=1 Tax=Ancylostoma ceylanicum TaxID=53326 RepID=A0A016X079_9BILA|nr:hypothetical protein Y032_0432g1362 [Ancylostoma ceylanicum]
MMMQLQSSTMDIETLKTVLQQSNHPATTKQPNYAAMTSHNTPWVKHTTSSVLETPIQELIQSLKALKSPCFFQRPVKTPLVQSAGASSHQIHRPIMWKFAEIHIDSFKKQ